MCTCQAQICVHVFRLDKCVVPCLSLVVRTLPQHGGHTHNVFPGNFDVCALDVTIFGQEGNG